MLYILFCSAQTNLMTGNQSEVSFSSHCDPAFLFEYDLSYEPDQTPVASIFKLLDDEAECPISIHYSLLRYNEIQFDLVISGISGICKLAFLFHNQNLVGKLTFESEFTCRILKSENHVCGLLWTVFVLFIELDALISSLQKPLALWNGLEVGHKFS